MGKRSQSCDVSCPIRLKNALRCCCSARCPGRGEPSADNIKKILSSVGIDADDEKVNQVVSELAGKDIEELIKEGTEKLGSVPAGAAPAAGGAAPAGDAAPAAAAAKEPEPESEEDDDMGFGLFD